MQQLPTERDFSFDGELIHENDLDTPTAWKNFGGLTVDEAIARFREHPSYYSEDFCWMGGRAFAFYFAVIEDYVRTSPVCRHRTIGEADWFAYCIRCQFRDYFPDVRHLISRILALHAFVVAHPERFGWNEASRAATVKCWTEAVEFVRSACESHDPSS